MDREIRIKKEELGNLSKANTERDIFRGGNTWEYNSLASFSKFLGLLMEGFEEILNLKNEIHPKRQKGKGKGGSNSPSSRNWI